MKRRSLTIALFLAPSLILISVFVLIPVIVSLVLSFTNLDLAGLTGSRQVAMVNLSNYVNLFKDPLFIKCIRNTFYFMLLEIPIAVILAAGVAILLNRPATYLRNFFKIGYFMPQITDAIAVSTVFFWIASKDYGFANMVLGAVGIKGPSWLTDIRLVMPTIATMAIWRNLGYFIVLYLAGMQGIPEHLYEAAEIDGATSWQKTRFVTLPLLRPTTLFITIMAVIGGLQLFAEPLVLTAGGPMDATRSIMMYLYENGFRYFKFGYAAAVSFVLFAFSFIATMIQMKLRDKEIGY